MKILFSMLLVASTASADFATYDFQHSWDSEDSTTTRHLIGYGTTLNESEIGIKHGTYNVADANGSTNFNETRLFGSSNFSSGGIDGYVGTLYNSNWDTPSYDVTGWWTPIEPLYIEANTSGSIVETTNAINSEISLSSVGFSIDVMILDNVTVVGGFNSFSFSDGNTKNIFTTKFVYSFLSVDGLYAYVENKSFSNDFNPPEYFAPSELIRRMVFIGYNTSFLDRQFSLRSKYGIGSQTLPFAGSEFVDLLEIKITGSIGSNTRITGEFLTTGDKGDYPYRYNTITVGFEYYF
mgnify:CR=1 FL=1